MNIALINPPTDVRRPDVSLKQAHVDLIARIASIDVPLIPIDVQGRHQLALSLYESAIIETFRRHFREVMDVAKANGVTTEGVTNQAENMLTDIQSDLQGTFDAAAAEMDGRP